MHTKVRHIAVSDIKFNPHTPRHPFTVAKLRTLAEDIKVNGILQPISICVNNGRYELVSGEKRLRAAHLAGLKKIPCLVVHTNNEESPLLHTMETLRRKDLNMFEEAKYFALFIRQFNFSHDEAALLLSKPTGYILEKLSLLRHTEECVTLILEQNVSERIARAVLRIDDEQLCTDTLRIIIEQAMTDTQAERYVDAAVARQAEHMPLPCVQTQLFMQSLEAAVGQLRIAGIPVQVSREPAADDEVITMVIKRSKNVSASGTF